MTDASGNVMEHAFKERRTVAFFGYIVLGLAAFGFLFIASRHMSIIAIDNPLANEQLYVWLMRTFFIDLLFFIGSMIFLMVGLRLLSSAGKVNTKRIPESDKALLHQLIKDGNSNGIKQYVIISSLSSFTGSFQKIGFTGLPLATVVLTLIFSMLAILYPENNKFIDFAQLTLGAFIGSFIQKKEGVYENTQPLSSSKNQSSS